MASTIKKKKVFLILTLFSVASNLTVNKNTVSPGTKLLIQPPFKIIPLQIFFLQCFPSKLQLLLLIYLFMYLFSLCVSVFFVLEGEGVFLPFFTFHILWNSTLSFPPCDMEYSVSETTVRFQIKNGWSGCYIELLNASRDLSDGYGTRFSSPPLLPLPLSAPGVSLCSQNNAWVMRVLGKRCSVQRFSTNASHNDHVLLPLCTPSTISTPLEICAP